MQRAADPTPDLPITRAVVLNARFARPVLTSRVEVREIRLLPDQVAGLHVHNCPVVGAVLSGSVIYQIEGGDAVRLGPGDVFHEPEGERIARFDATEEGVTFLGYFLLTEGQEAELTFPEN
jgi:quercetin dioxygenase-like cupin family protein